MGKRGSRIQSLRLFSMPVTVLRIKGYDTEPSFNGDPLMNVTGKKSPFTSISSAALACDFATFMSDRSW